MTGWGSYLGPNYKGPEIGLGQILKIDRTGRRVRYWLQAAVQRIVIYVGLTPSFGQLATALADYRTAVRIANLASATVCRRHCIMGTAGAPP